MRDHKPHGLELRWVEVRDDRGSHMEARWSEASAAAPVQTGPVQTAPVQSAPVVTHTPHAA